jgi:transposase
MRKACRNCGHHWFWSLSDGRHKCRQCGQRQSFRSVWDSSFLSPASKRRLLEYFVLGVPAYRLRFRSPASPEATSRFFLLIRQVLAAQESGLIPFTPFEWHENELFAETSRHKAPPVWPVIFGVEENDGHIGISQIENEQYRELFCQIDAHKSLGHLYYTADQHAYASLAIRGNSVSLSADSTKTKAKGADHIDAIEGFWGYSQTWLRLYRSVPQKYLHLYLAEILFRYNNRDTDLFPLIHKALGQTDSMVIR